MVPQQQTKTVNYTVRVPVQVQVPVSYTVRVPQREMRTGYRTRRRVVTEQRTRTVMVRSGHYETRAYTYTSSGRGGGGRLGGMLGGRGRWRWWCGAVAAAAVAAAVAAGRLVAPRARRPVADACGFLRAVRRPSPTASAELSASEFLTPTVSRPSAAKLASGCAVAPSGSVRLAADKFARPAWSRNNALALVT